MKPKRIINPRDYGINTMLESDFTVSRDKAYAAVQTLLRVGQEHPPLPKEIAAYRKNVPIILQYMKTVEKFNGVLTRTFERYETDATEKHHKRWTEEEDELLIELACSGRSMLELSTAVGRSPASIKTRISKLVGIKRLSQEIAGRFIGTVNGVETDAEVNGTLYKGANA